MSKEELVDHIKDVHTFLCDLEAALPGKVEADLLSFLEQIGNHSWLSDLLIAQLTTAKSAKVVVQQRYK